MRRFLVIQTAFIGDAVLTLPLIQVLKKVRPDAAIDVLVIPRTAELFTTHPAVNRVLIFDKKGKDRGVQGLSRVSREMKEQKYDVALMPHRSMRSALLPRLAKIPVRIGFDRSAGWFMLTHEVRYEPSRHEVERNLSLLSALRLSWTEKELPELYPSRFDVDEVNAFLQRCPLRDVVEMIAVAPGSVWKTKRWLETHYIDLLDMLLHEGYAVILVGGKEDEELCQEIKSGTYSDQVIVAAGKLSLLQSAELIRRCALLVTNDSAPMHLAVAVRTPVAAIFGATVPEFGFAPYGGSDVVIETKGLACRPCSIHGGQRCPIKTFDCMVNITAHDVYNRMKAALDS